mmetsp:Transcript_1663/g.4521  ORF Transcript_1663/g.4521 Transcript_1663/m.4521 type:complete len:85 (-) Transcript_1663:144-398(-)
MEQLLQRSETGWVAGTPEPSAADFVWYVRLADYIPNTKELSESLRELKDFPSCRAFCDKFRKLEAIQEYYQKSQQSNKKQKTQD